jgi:hypothetical protein
MFEALRAKAAEARAIEKDSVRLFRIQHKLDRHIAKAEEQKKLIEAAGREFKPWLDSINSIDWQALGGINPEVRAHAQAIGDALYNVPRQLQLGIDFIRNLSVRHVADAPAQTLTLTTVNDLLNCGDVLGLMRMKRGQADRILRDLAGGLAITQPETAPRLKSELQSSEPAQQWDARFLK